MPRVLRVIAVLIAIAAFLDPAFVRHRSARPVVSLIATNSDGDAVRRALGQHFTLTAGALPGAEATIIAADGVPSINMSDIAPPVFAIVTDDEPRVSIASVNAPVRAPLDSRVRIATTVHASQANGDSVVVSLFLGDAAIDRVARAVHGDSATFTVPLWFVPAAQGANHLRVAAALQRTAATASSDLLVAALEKRYTVLFFDRRPSWMSTFVRRALERDPRFVVKSRVVTSRNISTTAGQPPDEFDAVAASELFDAVVVGAPDQLTERDVSGLESFMRRRGGGVVMLLDNTDGGRMQRLTRVAQWGGVTVDSGLALASTEPNDGSLKAVELAWPAALPPAAERMMISPRRARDTAAHAVVWRTSVGAGRLVVSGALDAWTFRDTASSEFDAFWRRTIAEAADATPPLVSVAVDESVVTPRERIAVTVTVRERALGDGSPAGDPPSIEAAWESNGEREAFPLWKTSKRGVYAARVRAPASQGAFVVAASVGAARGEASIVVTPVVSRARAAERDLLAEWTAAHRGRIFSSNRLSELSTELRAAIDAERRATMWHPMRSVWWIVPFVMALGAEWWWRRRKGYP